MNDLFTTQVPQRVFKRYKCSSTAVALINLFSKVPEQMTHSATASETRIMNFRGDKLGIRVIESVGSRVETDFVQVTE
jgi:hypothetical protein